MFGTAMRGRCSNSFPVSVAESHNADSNVSFFLQGVLNGIRKRKTYKRRTALL